MLALEPPYSGNRDDIFNQYFPGSLLQGRLCGMRATPCEDKLGCLNSVQLFFALPVRERLRSVAVRWGPALLVQFLIDLVLGRAPSSI